MALPSAVTHLCAMRKLFSRVPLSAFIIRKKNNHESKSVFVQQSFRNYIHMNSVLCSTSEEIIFYDYPHQHRFQINNINNMNIICTCRTAGRVSQTHYRFAQNSLFHTLAPISSPVLCIPKNGKLAVKRHKKKKAGIVESSSSDSDDEDSDDDSGIDDFVVEDMKFSPKFKETISYLKSLRSDAVLSAGLNISRSKIDDFFLASKILVNGERLLKKSYHVEIGDVVDLMSEQDERGKNTVKRVRLLSIAQGKTAKDKYIVKLRSWRVNVPVPT